MLKYFAAGISLCLALTTFSAQADTKIGYVHLQTIMQSSQFLSTGQKLQSEFNPRNAELQKQYKQLDDKTAALEKDGLTLSEAQLSAKRKDLANQRLDLDRKQRILQEDFEQRKQEELASLQDRINKAVVAVAQSEGYDLVLYNTSAYVGKNADITDKIIKQLSTTK